MDFTKFLSDFEADCKEEYFSIDQLRELRDCLNYYLQKQSEREFTNCVQDVINAVERLRLTFPYAFNDCIEIRAHCGKTFESNNATLEALCDLGSWYSGDEE